MDLLVNNFLIIPSSSVPASSFVASTIVVDTATTTTSIATKNNFAPSYKSWSLSMGWRYNIILLRRSFPILLLQPIISVSATRASSSLSLLPAKKNNYSTVMLSADSPGITHLSLLTRNDDHTNVGVSRWGGPAIASTHRNFFSQTTIPPWDKIGACDGRLLRTKSLRMRCIPSLCYFKRASSSTTTTTTTTSAISTAPLFVENKRMSGSFFTSMKSSSSSRVVSSSMMRYFSKTSNDDDESKSFPSTIMDIERGSSGMESRSSKLSSARAQAAIQLLPSYIADARAVTKYSPTVSPEGALQLSVAENQMSELPIRGLIGISEYGERSIDRLDSMNAVHDGGNREMTLMDVLSQLASSKYPRPSSEDVVVGGAGECSAYENVFQRDMIYYQPTHGVPSVRRAMANYLHSLLLLPNTQNTISRTFIPDNVILGAGCNAVLENLCMCLANPGDAALIPTPYYASFEFDLSSRAGCHIVPVNTFHHHPDGQTVTSSPIAEEFYYPNRSSLDAAYYRALKETGRPPRILLLSHPNNPLGICYPPRVIRECIDWCREKEVHLISDEIYAGSVYRKERYTGIDKGQPTFVSAMALGSSNTDAPNLNGLGLGPYIHLVYALSKDFALSGLRVGVAYTENDEILLPLQKLNDMCQISSQTQLLVERMMWAKAISVNNASDMKDHESLPLFRDIYRKANNDNIRARCEKLLSFLHDLGIPVLSADSGLFVWMDLREFLPRLSEGTSKDAETIESMQIRERQLYLLLMKKYGLLFTPGMSMRSELAGFFRFVFTAASNEEFALGLVRLRTAVKEMRGM